MKISRALSFLLFRHDLKVNKYLEIGPCKFSEKIFEGNENIQRFANLMFQKHDLNVKKYLAFCRFKFLEKII